MRGGGAGGGDSVGGGGEVVKEISSDSEWEWRIRWLGRAFLGSACLLNLPVLRMGGWKEAKQLPGLEDIRDLNCCSWKPCIFYYSLTIRLLKKKDKKL